MARLLTQAQFSRKTKYSRARINQFVKEGIIVTKDGLIDPAQAENGILTHVGHLRLPRQRRTKTKTISAGNVEICEECPTAGENKTFFCKRLNLTITMH